MLKDLVTASRSYRSFDQSVKITCEQLLDWIDCARLAPSSVNLQMLKFRPVIDQTECEAVLSCTRWAGKLKELTLPPKGHAPVAYIVICADLGIIPSATSFQKDVGICAQTIMLAAMEAGIGGCMIGSFSAETIKNALSLPAQAEPQLILALGKPDEKVCLTDLCESGDTSYFRQNGIHYVPKRKLEDVLL